VATFQKGDDIRVPPSPANAGTLNWLPKWRIAANSDKRLHTVGKVTKMIIRSLIDQTIPLLILKSVPLRDDEKLEFIH